MQDRKGSDLENTVLAVLQALGVCFILACTIVVIHAAWTGGMW